MASEPTIVSEHNIEYMVFFDAIRNSDDDLFSIALSSKIDVNVMQYDPENGPGAHTALHIAAESGNSHAIKCLLERGASVDTPNTDPYSSSTALHNAALFGHLDAVRELLDAGADRLIENCWGPAMFNVLANKRTVTPEMIEIIELFLDYGQDVNAPGDEWGTNMAQEAAALCSLDLLRILVQRGANLDKALWVSSGKNPSHQEIIHFLLDNGARIGVNADGRGTALTIAASGTLELVQLLYSHANEAELGASQTAILEASGRPDLDVVEYLLGKGFDINVYDKSSGTPLHWACESNRAPLEMVQLLLANGASISARRHRSGNTPLHTAVCSGHIEKASLLLDAGANINEPNNDGNTPLAASVFKPQRNPPYRSRNNHADPRPDMTKFLLRRGADMYYKNKQSESALHLLARAYQGQRKQDNIKIAKILIEHGAERQACNDDGKTALDLVTSKGITGWRDIAYVFREPTDEDDKT